MNFLVDAQLPARLSRFLATTGHDCTHTSDMPVGNRTADDAVAARADQDDRVVITKDRDFRDGHLLRSTPRRLLVVTTGNISNNALLALFETHLKSIVTTLNDSNFVELRSDRLIIHSDHDTADGE